jgi:hypothetical protein
MSNKEVERDLFSGGKKVVGGLSREVMSELRPE